MADKKISDLTEDTAPTSDDLVETEHDPGGTPASRKASLANLTKGLSVMVGDSGSGGTKGLVPAPASGDAAAGKYLDAAGGFSVPPGTGLTTEQVQDIVGAMIVGGTDIDATYDDGAGTVTIDATGGGGGGSGTMSYVLLPNTYPTANTTNGIGTVNQVRVFRFYLPGSLTVNRIAWRSGTSGSAANWAVGVYSADGNTKLADSGAQANAATTVYDVALGAPVVLAAGHYWLAWTCDSTTPTLVAQAISTSAALVVNATTVQTGTAANASAAGVLPATLGAISALDVAIPIVKLQN